MIEGKTVSTLFTNICPICDHASYLQDVSPTIEIFTNTCLKCYNEFVVRNPFFQLKIPVTNPAKEYEYTVHPSEKTEDDVGFNVCGYARCTLSTVKDRVASYRVILLLESAQWLLSSKESGQLRAILERVKKTYLWN